VSTLKWINHAKKNRRPKPYHHGDLRRALIETALQLVTQDQDWTFSLREVARRAGVSHRAPYNHFPEKQDLLSAVAVVGFEKLRDGLLRATAGNAAPEALVEAIGRTYVRLGLENPALYRLMFGPALAGTGATDRPSVARAAGDRARAILEDAILRGTRLVQAASHPAARPCWTAQTRHQYRHLLETDASPVEGCRPSRGVGRGRRSRRPFRGRVLVHFPAPVKVL
jgi:AcrR family transcriptional regulator